MEPAFISGMAPHPHLFPAENFEKGYFVQPTSFADVHSQMKIAKEISGHISALIEFSIEQGSQLFSLL